MKYEEIKRNGLVFRFKTDDGISENQKDPISGIGYYAGMFLSNHQWEIGGNPPVNKCTYKGERCIVTYICPVDTFVELVPMKQDADIGNGKGVGVDVDVHRSDFKDYLEQARKDFAKVASKYSVKENLALRTAIDSFLIAYDQAVNKIS